VRLISLVEPVLGADGRDTPDGSHIIDIGYRLGASIAYTTAMFWRRMNSLAAVTVTKLALIFVLALTIRIALVLCIGDSLHFGDSRDYLNTAKTVCQGSHYPQQQGNLPFFRAPGLPLFICVVTGCNPDKVVLIEIALAFVDSMLAVVCFLMALVLFDNRASAFVSAALAAVHPGFIYQVTDIRTEPLFMFFLSSSLLAFFHARQRMKTGSLVFSGLFLGLASLIRPVALVAVPFMTLFWLLSDSESIGRRARGSILLLVASMATMCPWILYMASRYGELILVNDAGGYNLWRGAHPVLRQALLADDRKTYYRFGRHFERVVSRSEASRVYAVADSPMERSREWRRRAFKLIAEDPTGYLSYTIWKGLQFWRPWLNPQVYSKPIVGLSAVFISALYLLGLYGLVLLRKRNLWYSTFVVCWFALACLAHAPFQVVMRFRVPFTDPLLLALSGFALHHLYKTVSRFINKQPG
jgi:4-amino-4-deoxy-L-arabinose transferase-like glycosyltransferase